MKSIIETTADGSHTLFVPGLDEHYHSVNGAVQESRHVFIDAGLHRLRKDRLRILEVGFGTGLNAFLTLLDGGAAAVTYYAVEKYPLPTDVARQLNYGAILAPGGDAAAFLRLHEAPWEHDAAISDRFTLHKMQADINGCRLPPAIDLVYFDAFAPGKQPEVWNQAVFDALYACMTPGGILTTYCAKGEVRRMMQRAGYSVERIPGPPGKREMLRAVCQAPYLRSASTLST